MTGPTPPQPPPRAAAGNDPSMEDILASIRRILTEDESAPAPASAGAPAEAEVAANDDVLVLDAALIVPQEPPAPPEPPPRQVAADAASTPGPDDTVLDPSLAAPSTAAEAAASIGDLVRTLSAERDTRVRQAGPTLEDMVREELRPLVKTWLDRHLPALVERMVRAEIERVVGRGMR